MSADTDKKLDPNIQRLARDVRQVLDAWLKAGEKEARREAAAKSYELLAAMARAGL